MAVYEFEFHGLTAMEIIRRVDAFRTLYGEYNAEIRGTFEYVENDKIFNAYGVTRGYKVDGIGRKYIRVVTPEGDTLSVPITPNIALKSFERAPILWLISKNA